MGSSPAAVTSLGLWHFSDNENRIYCVLYKFSCPTAKFANVRHIESKV